MTKLQQVHYRADMKQFLLDIQCTLKSNLNNKHSTICPAKMRLLKIHEHFIRSCYSKNVSGPHFFWTHCMNN